MKIDTSLLFKLLDKFERFFLNSSLRTFLMLGALGAGIYLLYKDIKSLLKSNFKENL